jgi:hypothetical protein
MFSPAKILGIASSCALVGVVMPSEANNCCKGSVRLRNIDLDIVITPWFFIL